MSASNTLTVEVYRGADRIVSREFSEQSVTIGSSPAALLQVEDSSVSEIHCVLNVESGTSAMLLDLHSKQGTIFNGKRVPSAHLVSGDEFFVGILRVRVLLGATTAAGTGDLLDDDDPTEEPTVGPAPVAAKTPTPKPAPPKKATPAPVAAQKAAPAPTPAAKRPFISKTPVAAAPAHGDDELMEDGMSFVMRAGTAAGSLGVNAKRPRVLEVNQVWGDTLMDTKHFPHTGEEVSLGGSLGHRWHFLGVDMGWVPAPLHMVLPYTPPMWSEVHSSWRNDFYAPVDSLPGQKDHNLFTFEDGQYVAHVESGWDGFADIGEQRYALSELVAAGKAKAEGGGYAIPMTDDIRLAVEIDGVMYFSHRVLEGAKLIARNSEDPDYPFIAISGFMGFIGLMFGLVIYFLPTPGTMSMDEMPDRFAEIQIQKPEPEPEQDNKPDANPDAGEGAKPKDEEGKVGKKEETKKVAKGEKAAIDKAQKDREIVDNSGVFGAMADAGMDSTFGSSAMDSSLTGNIGGLIGVKGNQNGNGGLGSRGSGLGGGGTAGGLGGYGTKGGGTGKSGYGKGGGISGAKGSGGIGRIGGSPIILGALDRSLIDAVIKKNMRAIRYCYQRELAKKPSLGGKIVIKFTIAKDGSVSSARKKSSTMGNPAVESCIEGRFMRMKFPAPKGGGVVIVSYPFIFSPG